MGSNGKEESAANTRAGVQAAHLLEIVDSIRQARGQPGPGLNSVHYSAAAAWMRCPRIPPLENLGDQLNAVPEVGTRCRRWVVLAVLAL